MQSEFGKHHRRIAESIRGKVVVLVAALLVLCGTTYAAAALPKNSVGTKQLKKNAVNSSKVKNNSLTGADINASTLGTVPSATNADTLDGKHASDFLPAGAAISNADTLDGKHAYDFLGANATAFNSERLGNLLPSSFLQSGTNAGGDLTGTYPSPSIANGVITDSKVATANKDGAATVPSLRTLGTGAQQAMPGNATPGGPPSGPAGGALSGSYPNPSLNVSGGPCSDREALRDISSLAALTCGPGVYAAGASTAVPGDTALTSNTEGEDNSAFGHNALEFNTEGNGNTAVGAYALQANTTGEGNTAMGWEALQDNNSASASGNSAFGGGALYSNTSGNSNTAVGGGALRENAGGKLNSAFGSAALEKNSGGEKNTALGVKALFFNTGNNNIAIGWAAGGALTTGNNNIYLGSSGGAEESNTIHIGSNQTKAFLAGVTGVTTGGTASPVLVDGSGQLGTTSSSRRFKRDIHPLGTLSAKLMALKPVSFRYKRSYVHGPSSLQFGLIAEQVAKVYPNLVVYGRDDRPSAVAYQELPALLLAQAQREHARVNHQQQKIRALQADNTHLKAERRHQQGQIDWLIRQVKGRR